MRTSQLLAAIVALSSFSAAWPDVFDSSNALGEVKNVLYGRQDDNKSSQPSATPTDAPKSSAKESSDAPQSTGDAKSSDNPSDDKATSTAKDTGKATGSQKPSSTKGGKASSEPAYDPRLPAGGIQMVTPAPLAGPQYYKVGDHVTFAWNYTSLSVTPNHIDILATCTSNQATYTIAVNQTAKQTEVVWDTGAHLNDANAVPFVVASYTLMIYDSDKSVTEAPKAGYLGAYKQFQFGMYTKQPYKDFDAGYQCPTCNGALSAFELLTLKAMIVTSGTTIASLLYFAYSFGVI